MHESIGKLEKRRAALFSKLAEVGDFRRGSISSNYRKCGKENCACSTEGHPGHGPQYLWTTTRHGKSLAKKLTLGPELDKYKGEIDEYRKFRNLCSEIVEISEKICNIGPICNVEDESELEVPKKKLQDFFGTKSKGKRTRSFPPA